MCSGRNEGQKLVSRFLAFYRLCTVNLADHNGLWSVKCWNWSENGQWPAAISKADVNTKLRIYKVVNTFFCVSQAFKSSLSHLHLLQPPSQFLVHHLLPPEIYELQSNSENHYLNT